MNDYGYLQHGKNGGPMATEKVRIRNSHLDNWQAFYMGKWRKVHVNVQRTFIM